MWNFIVFAAFWVLLAGLVAFLARRRGRPAAQWFTYGVAALPLALPHIFFTPHAEPPETTTERADVNDQRLRDAHAEVRSIDEGMRETLPREA